MSCSIIKWSERLQNITAKILKIDYRFSRAVVARFECFQRELQISISVVSPQNRFHPSDLPERLEASSPDQLKEVKVHEAISKLEKLSLSAIRPQGFAAPLAADYVLPDRLTRVPRGHGLRTEFMFLQLPAGVIRLHEARDSADV